MPSLSRRDFIELPKEQEIVIDPAQLEAAARTLETLAVRAGAEDELPTLLEMIGYDK